MQRLLFLVLCLTLAACDERAAPLSAYRHPEDAMASVLPLALAGVYPCASRQKEDGIDVVARLATDQCYKMQPARRGRLDR
ncbi:hypothetical protein [Sphingomonas sp. LM7]|uniref:hypothetical protein n=1 Tax=Sphingomonas sp. LM7 TaxID=1938607 RepID=UPI000983DE66|nr:hypothetical protein [Sphingomonas sp. LM7]AQR72371.1 hypothetical protein BXU08_00640 [Sphingomonas sp. LM7]